jgi:hypothetical protein
MSIWGKIQHRIGRFILEHILTREVVDGWKKDYIEDPLPWLYPERTTDAISEQDIEDAMKQTQRNITAVRGGRSLNVPPHALRPTKLAPWYWNQRMSEQETMECQAIKGGQQ